MGKKPKTLEKIESLLNQLQFNDQQKADWVSEYKDRYQILHNKNVEDTVKCIMHPLIFGDKEERQDALELLRLTFVKRDHLQGASSTIDIFRHSPELLIDEVNLYREIARHVRTDAHKRNKEWERTYGAALQGELLEAVIKNSEVPLTEESKAKIRSDHKLYARRLERDKARERQQKTALAKTPFKGAQDALDDINDIFGHTDRRAEIKMKRLEDPRTERYFAMSVFAEIHSLSFDDVFEIYTAWEKQNPPGCPPKSGN